MSHHDISKFRCITGDEGHFSQNVYTLNKVTHVIWYFTLTWIKYLTVLHFQEKNLSLNQQWNLAPAYAHYNYNWCHNRQKNVNYKWAFHIIMMVVSSISDYEYTIHTVCIVKHFASIHNWWSVQIIPYYSWENKYSSSGKLRFWEVQKVYTVCCSYCF